MSTTLSRPCDCCNGEGTIPCPDCNGKGSHSIEWETANLRGEFSGHPYLQDLLALQADASRIRRQTKALVQQLPRFQASYEAQQESCLAIVRQQFQKLLAP